MGLIRSTDCSLMLRFSASQTTKIRFKVYISFLKKKKDFGDAEKTIENLLLNYNQDIGCEFVTQEVSCSDYSGSSP